MKKDNIFKKAIENSSYKVYIPKDLRKPLRDLGWLINKNGFRVRKTKWKNV